MKTWGKEGVLEFLQHIIEDYQDTLKNTMVNVKSVEKILGRERSCVTGVMCNWATAGSLRKLYKTALLTKTYEA